MLVSEFIAPIIASIFMEKNVWIPLLIAVALQMSTVLISAFMPETRPQGHDEQNNEDMEDDEANVEPDKRNCMSIHTRCERFQDFCYRILRWHF